MPELPEAETIVRSLRRILPGSILGRPDVLRPDVVDGAPGAFGSSTEGRAVTEVERRGKNIRVCLDDGTSVVVNLGMSGRLLHRPAAPGAPTDPEPTHPAVIWPLSSGGTLVYHDIRRFGRIRLLDPADYEAWSRRLGPEPLGAEFTVPYLTEALGRSRSPLRSWLLDQRRVAGIGNIYALEALHLARLHPALPASLTPPESARSLHGGIRKVLRQAIAAGGTTLRDYRRVDGGKGSYAAHLRVYGREGEACHDCTVPIERVVFGQRSAFYCPRCQRRPGIEP